MIADNVIDNVAQERNSVTPEVNGQDGSEPVVTEPVVTTVQRNITPSIGEAFETEVEQQKQESQQIEDNWWEKDETLKEFAPKDNETNVDAVNKLATAFKDLKQQTQQNTKVRLDIPQSIDGYTIDTKSMEWKSKNGTDTIEIPNTYTDDELKQLKEFGLTHKLTQDQLQSLYDVYNQTRYFQIRNAAKVQQQTINSFLQRLDIQLTADEQKELQAIQSNEERQKVASQKMDAHVSNKLDVFGKGCKYFCEQLSTDAHSKIDADKIINQLLSAQQAGYDVSEAIYAFSKCTKTTRSAQEIAENAARYGSMPASKTDLDNLSYSDLMGLASSATASANNQLAQYYFELANQKLRK